MIKRVISKIKQFRSNPDLREVGKSTLVAFGLKIVGAVTAFLFTLVLARLLGAEGSGIYFLALSIVVVSSVVGRIGLDNALVRFIATYAVHGEWGKVSGVHGVGIWFATIVSILVSLCVFFAAPWLAEEVFNKPGLEEPLRWMTLAILPFVWLNLKAESLLGLKRVSYGAFIQSAALPLCSLLLVYPLVQFAGVTGAIWTYLIAVVTVSLIGFWAWNRTLKGFHFVENRTMLKELLQSCAPLFVVSVVNKAILPWGSLLVIGVWVSSEEVGIYGAASRVSLLVAVLLQVANTVLAPKFAEFIAKDDMKGLAYTARSSAFLVTLLVSPVFLLLLFGSEYVMAMFGSEFREGALVLSILSLGQFVSVFSGSVGKLLIMSGNEKIFRNITLTSAIILVICLVTLVPIFGIIGAAVSSMLSLSFLNVVSILQIKKKLGFSMIFWMRNEGGGKA